MVSKAYIDPESGLAFLSSDGQLPPGARRVEIFANAGSFTAAMYGAGCAEEETRQATDEPSPANAGAAFGPAGPATDAEEVYRDYQALPLSERLRFWLFLNDGEQDFTLETLRGLKKRLDSVRVDITDRSEYERAYEPMRAALGLLGANARLSVADETADEPGAAPTLPQPSERPAPSPPGRGKLLGGRVRR